MRSPQKLIETVFYVSVSIAAAIYIVTQLGYAF